MSDKLILVEVHCRQTRAPVCGCFGRIWPALPFRNRISMQLLLAIENDERLGEKKRHFIRRIMLPIVTENNQEWIIFSDVGYTIDCGSGRLVFVVLFCCELLKLKFEKGGLIISWWLRWIRLFPFFNKRFLIYTSWLNLRHRHKSEFMFGNMKQPVHTPHLPHTLCYVFKRIYLLGSFHLTQNIGFVSRHI